MEKIKANRRFRPGQDMQYNSGNFKAKPNTSRMESFPPTCCLIALAIEVAAVVLYIFPWSRTSICFYFFHRWPRTSVPHAAKSPGIGMCRTASRTMRTEGHCCPRACKTWRCTISNTIVIKKSISFSLYFFNLYCIAYCTRPRFTGPGATVPFSSHGPGSCPAHAYVRALGGLRHQGPRPAMDKKNANERFLTRARYVIQWRPLQWLKR